MAPKSKKILVVEDAPTQAEHVRLILEDSGYDVTIAKDGQEALEKLPGLKPDLVISDIIMPGIDGYHLCQKIKSDPQYGRVPVILLTSLKDVTDVMRGLEFGADNFLTKPFEKDYFLARVKYALTKMPVDKSNVEEGMVELEFSGTKYSIHSSQRQIMNLLLSTFEAAVQRNRELVSTQNELQVINEQLERNNLKLRSVNEELEKFSYSVSHDLKGPLRAINGFISIFLEDFAGDVDEKGKEFLTKAKMASEQMKMLIDGLLDFSKMSQRELRITDVDLSKMVTELFDNLKNLEPERKVKITIAHKMIARGDEFLLRAVVENLVRNAWKFTSKVASAKIEFGVEGSDRALKYYIKDNGAGFDMKMAADLFTPFRRLHTESEFEGSGIGLATVQRIIHRHGGNIWATGEPGKGACFYFTLS